MKSDSNQFSECTTKEQALDLYFERMNEIQETAKRKYGIESHEFAELFKNEFHNATTPIPAEHSERMNEQQISQFPAHDSCSMSYSQLRRCAIYIVLFALVFTLVNYRAELSKAFMRNIQVYIYPGMRLWRQLTLPILRQFPELTSLYDETCLIPNPFFRVANLDCSPCADVINVVDLSLVHDLGYLGHNVPHIIKQDDGINQTIAKIYQLYQRNRQMFREDAYKIRSTDTNIANLDQLFSVIMNKNEESHSKSSHNLWRIKRMKPARILRTLFPAPKTLPEHAGIDIERFISFDVNGGVPYQLPSTDCSNMFVYQAIGSRIIHLQPTTECTDKCRRVTVKLKQSHTLFYDWWYYKPISAPDDQVAKKTSVSYIGAYC